jgi:hypothetical protein
MKSQQFFFCSRVDVVAVVKTGTMMTANLWTTKRRIPHEKNEVQEKKKARLASVSKANFVSVSVQVATVVCNEHL